MCAVTLKEIIVLDWKIEDSKFDKDGEPTKRLCVQIEFKGDKHIFFTSSKTLMGMISKVPKSEHFKTTIVKDNDRFEFT